MVSNNLGRRLQAVKSWAGTVEGEIVSTVEPVQPKQHPSAGCNGFTVKAFNGDRRKHVAESNEFV